MDSKACEVIAGGMAIAASKIVDAFGQSAPDSREDAIKYISNHIDDLGGIQDLLSKAAQKNIDLTDQYIENIAEEILDDMCNRGYFSFKTQEVSK